MYMLCKYECEESISVHDYPVLEIQNFKESNQCVAIKLFQDLKCCKSLSVPNSSFSRTNFYFLTFVYKF